MVLTGLSLLVLIILAGGEDPTAIPVPDPIPTLSPTAIVAPTLRAIATPTLEPVPTATTPVTPSPTVPPISATATPAPQLQAPDDSPVVTDGELFIQLVEPAELETVSDAATIKVVGRTRIDAIVTVDDTIVEPDIDGTFSATVDLEEGPNIIEVVASVASGEQEDIVLVVIYLP